jgi:hypothetical protein
MRLASSILNQAGPDPGLDEAASRKGAQGSHQGRSLESREARMEHRAAARSTDANVDSECRGHPLRSASGELPVRDVQHERSTVASPENRGMAEGDGLAQGQALVNRLTCSPDTAAEMPALTQLAGGCRDLQSTVASSPAHRGSLLDMPESDRVRPALGCGLQEILLSMNQIVRDVARGAYNDSSKPLTECPA